ncbi:MAG TPA: hypothetical protein VFG45_05875 [Candidatus Nitrosocosmicus sp.]|nr:hypothetical protein [Candidatus Nitrosocosmicus sp.]
MSKIILTVIATVLILSLVYNISHVSNILGETKSSDIDCIPESNSNIVDCCYKEYDSDSGETTAIYCTTCYDDGIGNLACGEYDKIEVSSPSDDGDSSPKGPRDIQPANPPSDMAPPPSTEKCPDNVAVDKNGNCNPITKTPDEGNDEGSDKPNLRGNMLDELKFGQSQDSSTSEEEQEEGNDQTNG